MSVGSRVSSDHQLVRLLQLGIVLEEVVEARAGRHHRRLPADEREELDPAIEALLTEAEAESAEHRERLEALIDDLDADTVPFDRVEELVERQYGQTRPEDFDDILYDQLHAEESAYKFYDDLIEAIETSDAEFGIDRETLLGTLRDIREEEAEGVEDVTELMKQP